MNCKTCFTKIDMRSAVRCSTCSEALHKDCAINDGGTFFCDVCYTVKQEEGNKSEIVIPDVIRRSYIETYKSCPYKFYMQVIKGYEMPPNIYTQLGIDLHELIEKACQDKSYLKADMMKDFNNIWNEYNDELFDDVDRDKMYARGIDSIDTIYEILKTLPEKPYTSEETINFSIGENMPLVQATSDRVDLINGELEVSDWKTGAVMVGQKLSTDLQAPLYINSIKEKYNMPVRKFIFYYLQENKKRVFERVDENNYVCIVGKREYRINLIDAIREVKTMFGRIKKGQFNIPRDTRKMYFTCKMCHLRKQEICSGADIQVWKQYNQN